jgi:hypothetical protein
LGLFAGDVVTERAADRRSIDPIDLSVNAAIARVCKIEIQAADVLVAVSISGVFVAEDP